MPKRTVVCWSWLDVMCPPNGSISPLLSRKKERRKSDGKTSHGQFNKAKAMCGSKGRDLFLTSHWQEMFSYFPRKQGFSMCCGCSKIQTFLWITNASNPLVFTPEQMSFGMECPWVSSGQLCTTMVGEYRRDPTHGSHMLCQPFAGEVIAGNR